ncbi:hypothetical protein DL95DRAFT_19263 [Leptodontidium sp. 2 PMI_412]|nr:hypothetical protein DL95DRAFT_19263 [Leptodontidium sp. 2 PMI_412]
MQKAISYTTLPCQPTPYHATVPTCISTSHSMPCHIHSNPCQSTPKISSHPKPAPMRRREKTAERQQCMYCNAAWYGTLSKCMYRSIAETRWVHDARYIRYARLCPCLHSPDLYSGSGSGSVPGICIVDSPREMSFQVRTGATETSCCRLAS